MGTRTAGSSRRSRGTLAVIAVLLVFGVAGCSLLTGGDAPAYQRWEPAASPDGTQIAYASPVEDGFEIFLMDIASGAERQLTTDGVVNWAPSWSPDGTRLVFTSERSDNIDLYVVRIETGEQERITTHSGEDYNPSWSASGEILFNSTRSGSWEIYSVNPDEGAIRQLTEPRAEEGSDSEASEPLT
ncbi:PD40 domain-containing protein [Candidatus Bipolaricaulota bacterium]|nr:PD40 domain-containing protein [Candidatus Bipolaricaulota bacterium]